MASILDSGFLRLSQIIGDKRSNRNIPPLIPVGKTTWWDGVKTGRFPKPIKLGSRITVWRVEDIREFINLSEHTTETTSKKSSSLPKQEKPKRSSV